MQLTDGSRRLRISLPAKLTIVLAVFAVAIAAVHVLSIDRLVHADAASKLVRDRWLEEIRVLSDVGRAVSALRIAEGKILLGDGDRSGSSELPARIDAAQRAIDHFRTLPHDADDTAALDAFLQAWSGYVGHVKETMAVYAAGHREDAVAKFNESGAASFEPATDGLRQLRSLIDAKAEAARSHAAVSITNARRWISDLIAGALLLFAALAGYLWWGVSRPLLELGGVMRRLIAHDTAAPIRFEKRGDEIGEMARALTILRRNTIELLEARKRLSSQAEVLSSALAKERAVTTEQRNFIHMISHEFRTPLTVIDGHAQRLIATSRADRPDIADRAQKIRTAVFGMTNLVASLADAAELSAGDLQTRMRSFDLDQMLRALGRYYLDIGAGRMLNYISSLKEPVAGDPALLYQAFSNLLSNAFKYSPERAIVTVIAHTTEEGVVVRIEDRGRGIPRAEIDRIGERYFRAANVGSIPGTGMGLHLVQAIIRRHGGRLIIESQEGEGTRMTVILPLEGSERLPERPSEHHPVRGRRSGDGELTGGSAAGTGTHG